MGNGGQFAELWGPYHTTVLEQLRTDKKKFWNGLTFAVHSAHLLKYVCNFPAIDFWHNVHDAISENWPRGGAGKRASAPSERPADSHIDCITRTHAYANPEPLMLLLLLRPREGGNYIPTITFAQNVER